MGLPLNTELSFQWGIEKAYDAKVLAFHPVISPRGMRASNFVYLYSYLVSKLLRKVCPIRLLGELLHGRYR